MKKNWNSYASKNTDSTATFNFDTTSFADGDISRYVELINALIKGYAEIGFQRSRSCMTEVYKFLVSQGAIVKDQNGYHYNADFEMGELDDEK